MNWRCGLFLPILMFVAFIVPACSNEKKPENMVRETKTTTQQTKESIQEYGKKYVDKAKNARSLGEARTAGIDEATENIDKR